MIDVRITPLPVERVTEIKPSEAIRLGCLRKPRQAFGWYAAGLDATCVIGAMMDGGVYEVADSGRSGLTCPAGCGIAKSDPGRRLTSHLNDDHRWSRERIADWLEGLGL